MKETKERPILFNGEMVRAILDGRKTQTRRVITQVLTLQKPDFKTKSDWAYRNKKTALWEDVTTERFIEKWCPYGVIGDRLWVRETWATPGNWDDIKPSELIEHLGFNTDLIAYRATEKFGDVYFKWRPSIFMPRWASRVLLEITNVRVERINDISINDVYFEGADIINGWDSDDVIFAKFIELWDSINAKRGYSWESNPWVWVIEFKVIEGVA